MKSTLQRQVILDAVMSSCDHPNADTVLARAKAAHPSINLATVYRNLAVLEKAGKILRISMPDGDRFDKTVTPHAHFRCEQCGKVFDVLDIKDDVLIADLEDKYGCSIQKANLVFSGVCKECK